MWRWCIQISQTKKAIAASNKSNLCKVTQAIATSIQSTCSSRIRWQYKTKSWCFNKSKRKKANSKSNTNRSVKVKIKKVSKIRRSKTRQAKIRNSKSRQSKKVSLITRSKRQSSSLNLQIWQLGISRRHLNSRVVNWSITRSLKMR